MYYTYLDTPIGRFLLSGDGSSLSMASFTRGHQIREPHPGWTHDPAALRFATDQVEEYFAGGRTRFDMPLEMAGTTFQQSVWHLLLSIPFGQVWTYKQVAEKLGKPLACRAVGAANAANILPLIVPCHRLVGTNGSLTGFGGGLETKRWLLEFEGVIRPPKLAADSLDGSSVWVGGAKRGKSINRWQRVEPPPPDNRPVVGLRPLAISTERSHATVRTMEEQTMANQAEHGS